MEFVLICLMIIVLITIFEKKRKKSDIFVEKKISPLTPTELKFIKQLEPIIDKYDLKIIPQINLQSIFKTKKNDYASFNKIKAKSVDFAIIDKQYKYVAFIELDDYTHLYNDRMKRDSFVNNLFSINGLILKRIKVVNNYNIEELEKWIKEIV